MVARLAQAPGSPPTHRLRAVVLAADIVGFSRIRERLAEIHGPDGAWALSELLNQGQGRAVDAVTHFGGEVASLAGDSLLAFWPVELDAAHSRVAKKLSANA